MRLSDPAIPEADAVAVIHRALREGVTLLDTADVYAPSADEVGHNETLVARALSSWEGRPGTITTVSKGGLRRTGKAWRPDGRARHLYAACEGSLARLGVARVPIYQDGS